VEQPGTIRTYKKSSTPSGPFWRKVAVWSWTSQGWRSLRPANRP
jgi:hypothetical protein